MSWSGAVTVPEFGPSDSYENCREVFHVFRNVVSSLNIKLNPKELAVSGLPQLHLPGDSSLPTDHLPGLFSGKIRLE